MERLGDEDGAGNGEVVLAGDQRCAGKVRAGTHTLQDGGEGDEAASEVAVSAGTLFFVTSWMAYTS